MHGSTYTYYIKATICSFMRSRILELKVLSGVKTASVV
jgi:hypothetical protein